MMADIGRKSEAEFELPETKEVKAEEYDDTDL